MSRSPHTTALPARRRRNLAIAAGLVLGLGLVGSACSGSGPGGQLLLADDTAAGDQMQASTASTDIWAVDPGEQPSRSNLLAGSVTSPLYITDVNEDGTVARDLLSTQWNGQVLSSYVADRTTARVTLTADGFAYFVHLLSPAPGVRFSDNYLDLRTGDSAVVDVTGVSDVVVVVSEVESPVMALTSP